MVKAFGTFVALVALGYVLMIAVLPSPQVDGQEGRDGGRAAAARLAGEAAILVAPSDRGSADRRNRSTGRAS